MILADILSISASKNISCFNMTTLSDITTNLSDKINKKADSTVVNSLASKDELNNGLSNKANSIHRHNWNDIDGKPSIPGSPRAYVTETWVSGTSWYRIWSDGWKEQGGKTTQKVDQVTINLYKSYANTNYNVVIAAADDDGGGYAKAVNITSSSQFVIKSYNGGARGHLAYWSACGY